MKLNKKELTKIIISAIVLIIGMFIKEKSVSLVLYIIRIFNSRI